MKFLPQRLFFSRPLKLNKRVCNLKQEKFKSWYSQWLEANISPQDQLVCTQWFAGDTAEKEGEALPQRSTEQYFGQDQKRYTTASDIPAVSTD